MTSTKIESYGNVIDPLKEVLVGRTIIRVSREEEYGYMELDDATVLRFEANAYDCCSSAALTSLATCANLITDVKMVEDDIETRWGGSDERARIVVISEAGEIAAAECVTDPSSGYYLHGWSLDIWVVRP